MAWSGFSRFVIEFIRRSDDRPYRFLELRDAHLIALAQHPDCRGYSGLGDVSQGSRETISSASRARRRCRKGVQEEERSLISVTPPDSFRFPAILIRRFRQFVPEVRE